MSWASVQWQALKRQAEGNPRLKWALFLIVLLLAAFAWQALDGLRVSMQQQAIDEEARLRRTRALEGQDIWLARAAEAATMEDALWAQLPEASTVGLAQASLQNWLRGLSTAVAARRELNVSVDSAHVLESPAGVIRVHGRIAGALSARQAMEMLRQIESSPNLMVVETITIRSGRGGSVDIGINAYYRQPSGEQTP